jgi:hypothetical protein
VLYEWVCGSAGGEAHYLRVDDPSAPPIAICGALVDDLEVAPPGASKCEACQQQQSLLARVARHIFGQHDGGSR